MDSIWKVSKRTASKIVERMALVCFNCGWGEARCDLHHIVPQVKGGSDDHSNLTYLCPNCHRLAHTGKLKEFKTLDEVVGDRWKEFYNVTPRNKSRRPWTGIKCQTPTEALALGRKIRTQKAAANAAQKLEVLRQSGIDFTQHGWIQKASEVLEVAPQSVKRYLKAYAPDLIIGAKFRAPFKVVQNK